MRRIVGFFLISLIFAFGCKKEDDIIPPDRQPSYLHILGCTTVDTFHVSFDYYNANTTVIKNIYAGRNWPLSGYAEIEAAGVPDEFGNGKLWFTGYRDPAVSGNPIDTVMGPNDIVLADNDRSTIVLADSAGSVVYRKFTDSYTEGSGNVRFLNMKEGSVTAGLTTTDASVNISGIAELDASAFSSIPSGSYDFELRDASNSVIGTINGVFIGASGATTFYYNGNGSLGFFRH